jgi:hypothetical protein
MPVMLSRKAAAAAEAFTMVKSGARERDAHAALYEAAKNDPETFWEFSDTAMPADIRAAYDRVWQRLAKEGLC